MLKHALVLVTAVAVSLSAAQQIMKMSSGPHMAAAATAAPAPGLTPEPASVSDVATSGAQVVKGPGGHYWAEAEVDGHWIHCLIDTGASVVSLTPLDAQRLGLDPASLTYDVPLNTANGQAHAARVRLNYVAVAGARVEEVDAVVVPQGLTTSLLGMSYLGRLSRFEATPDSLILRP